jgi:hypothetical protein
MEFKKTDRMGLICAYRFILTITGVPAQAK